MNYLTLRHIQKNTPFFSLESIRLHEPKFRVDQLSRWHKKGYIRHLIRGWYFYRTHRKSTYVSNKLFLLLIFHSICFSLYNLIPEGVFQMTAVTSKKLKTLTQK
jgi:hypothetical protein